MASLKSMSGQEGKDPRVRNILWVNNWLVFLQNRMMLQYKNAVVSV